MPKIIFYLYNNIIKRGIKILNSLFRLLNKYFLSLFEGWKQRNLFNKVETYCMFLGYPRSGHSLVGSLLDAHPNIIMAHELNTLEYIKKGFSKNQIFHLILENSRNFTIGGRKWRRYSYKIPNQYQGKFSELKVIGDKKGGASIHKLRKHPELLCKLQNRIDIKIKYIHVYRNPYDNITTWARGKKQRQINDDIVKKTIDTYFSSVETISKLKSKLKNNVLDIKHEDIIDNPKLHLKKMCAFLGVKVTKDYLEACEKIVFKKPNKSRYKYEWTPHLIKMVKEKSSKYSFLKNYTFNS